MTTHLNTSEVQVTYDGARFVLTVPVEHPDAYAGSAVGGKVVMTTPYVENDDGATKTARILAPLALAEDRKLEIRTAPSASGLLEAHTSIMEFKSDQRIAAW